MTHTHTHFNPAKITLKYISSKAKEINYCTYLQFIIVVLCYLCGIWIYVPYFIPCELNSLFLGGILDLCVS